MASTPVVLILEDAVEAAFDFIHRLREFVIGDPPCDDATWERAIDNVTAALDALRAEMRKELIDRFGRSVDTSRGHPDRRGLRLQAPPVKGPLLSATAPNRGG